MGWPFQCIEDVARLDARLPRGTAFLHGFDGHAAVRVCPEIEAQVGIRAAGGGDRETRLREDVRVGNLVRAAT